MPRPSERIPLSDGARVVVIGGGPAGAFFAIRLLRRARALRRTLDVVVLEEKRDLRFYPSAPFPCHLEGCNYCAGGISPRLADLLRQDGLTLPEDLAVGRAESLTVHGDWKSIELTVPRDREMLFVFRGSRPHRRDRRYENFDSYLLLQAVEEGAVATPGEVYHLRCAPEARAQVSYRTREGAGERSATVEADLVVVATGVNSRVGMGRETNPLHRALAEAIPGFRPPRVRRATIAEMRLPERAGRLMHGQVHFALYGAGDLPIEMSSLIPKGEWLTVALLGRSVDEAGPHEHLRIVERFLELPHVRRLLPRSADLVPGCVCQPNMTVGVARHPWGHRIALVGDVAVSRLYKDGILSAYLTASALADCALDRGVDAGSLRRGYWPAVRRLHHDNWFGAVVFFVNRVTFSRRVLSRVVYQAVVSERKGRPAHGQRLARILWTIASGDDTYGHVLRAMFHPATIRLILVGGALVTVRNYLTERLFGLRWEGFGRHPTGVPREEVERKRGELAAALGEEWLGRRPGFECMYTIRVLAGPAAILGELGRFGDAGRRYFHPRLIQVLRTSGEANAVGSVIQYRVRPRVLSFAIVLEQGTGERYLLYRIRDGFARGGILVFDVEPKGEGLCLLSIYLAFDLPTGTSPLRRLAWRAGKRLLPTFVHDVLWNHALCELKHAVETSASG
ncbi:MAG: hypothetical protein AB1505_31980 [Candidatus Latescibacterota bacterium]